MSRDPLPSTCRALSRERAASGNVRTSCSVLLVILTFALLHVVAGESSSAPHQSISSSHKEILAHSDECRVTSGGPMGDTEGKYSAIDEFLSERDQTFLSRFHIHGWRWHTASLVRESGRLCTLAQRAKSAESDDDSNTMAKALHQAADYVVGFNMKGLHRIEADLMFPWMREKLTTIGDAAAEVSREFSHVMGKLESDRKTMVGLGDSIVRFSRKSGCSFVSLAKTYLFSNYLLPHTAQVRYDCHRWKLKSWSAARGHPRCD